MFVCRSICPSVRVSVVYPPMSCAVLFMVYNMECRQKIDFAKKTWRLFSGERDVAFTLGDLARIGAKDCLVRFRACPSVRQGHCEARR